jgi:hypothetical protein
LGMFDLYYSLLLDSKGLGPHWLWVETRYMAPRTPQSPQTSYWPVPRSSFCGNVLKVELSPGVRHVLSLLNCVLPGFLRKAKRALGPQVAQLPLPCYFPWRGLQHSSRRIPSYCPFRKGPQKTPVLSCTHSLPFCGHKWYTLITHLFIYSLKVDNWNTLDCQCSSVGGVFA